MSRPIRLTTCLLILCAVATMLGCSRTPAPEATNPEIQACYEAMDHALVKKDVEAYMKLVSKDVKVQPFQGAIKDYGALKEQTSELVKAAGSIECATKINKCAVKDGVATVVAESRLKGELEDSKGKHQIESSTTMLDTWRKSDKGWELVASLETARSTSRDGKPLTSDAKK